MLNILRRNGIDSSVVQPRNKKAGATTINGIIDNWCRYDCSFTIPNTAIIDVASRESGYTAYMLSEEDVWLQDKWKNEGLHVIKNYWGVSTETVKENMSNPDLFKYAYFGHGIDDGSLAADVRFVPGFDSGERIKPGTYTRFGINELRLYACFSGIGVNSVNWARNVSGAGWLLSYRVKIRGTNLEDAKQWRRGEKRFVPVSPREY